MSHLISAGYFNSWSAITYTKHVIIKTKNTSIWPQIKFPFDIKKPLTGNQTLHFMLIFANLPSTKMTLREGRPQIMYNFYQRDIKLEIIITPHPSLYFTNRKLRDFDLDIAYIWTWPSARHVESSLVFFAYSSFHMNISKVQICVKN